MDQIHRPVVKQITTVVAMLFKPYTRGMQYMEMLVIISVVLAKEREVNIKVFIG